jgi:hypothetical protein
MAGFYLFVVAYKTLFIHVFTFVYPLRGTSQGCGDGLNTVHNTVIPQLTNDPANEFFG